MIGLNMKYGSAILRLFAVMTAMMAGSQAGAQAPVDKIVAQLRGQGYEVVDVRRTLLGRIKVEAVSEGRKREIVFDRTTGEILRDYVEDAPSRGQAPKPVAPAATARAKTVPAKPATASPATA
ncbi:MAG: PepSY domain-containing protein, partial [Amaricoccus sp.]|uniref:PepSY domain-containing protein n=1 Tax=Amaricoccus sp. TaxID=1872485 RepID=UPI00331620A1